MEELRTCRICGEKKPVESFEIDKRLEGHHTRRCKSCKRKSNDRAVQAHYKLCQRAAKNGTEVDVTLAEIKSLFTAFDGVCVYCGAQEHPDGPTFHLEHVIPRSAGGRDHISNLVISCPTCNFKKSNKPVVTYFIDDERERFKDVNFTVLAHYLALTSGQPVSELVERLVDDYAIHLMRNLIKELEDCK